MYLTITGRQERVSSLRKEMEDLRAQIALREGAPSSPELSPSDPSNTDPARRLEIEILRTLKSDLAEKETEVCST